MHFQMQLQYADIRANLDFLNSWIFHTEALEHDARIRYRDNPLWQYVFAKLELQPRIDVCA